MRIGVIGYQGGVAEHVVMLRRAAERLGYSVEVVLVKRPEHLERLDGIVVPGGESTTIGKLMERLGVLEPLREMLEKGLPAMGTCAGAILLSKKVRDRVRGPVAQPLLGVVDAEAVRNYFGRQRESFEIDLEIEGVTGSKPFRGVFIRSPAFSEVWGSAKPIARLPGEGEIVAVKQGATLALAFHPELTGDTRLHEYWLQLVKG